MFNRLKLDKSFFSEPPALTESFHLIKKVQHKECSFFIESLSTLEKLFAEKRAQNDDDPILRFLVDMDGVAWFARETRPGNNAPKHFQMTGHSQDKARCRTAGNIKFTNSSCTVVKNINHKSGDFQPSFYSLRIFLAILILNEPILPFKLPRKLVVKELNGTGDVLRKHKWPVSQIRDWVNNFRDHTELVTRLVQKHADTKLVHYAETTGELCYET